MSLADGDEAIIDALARYQRLPTSSLVRLTGRGAHLIRRRARKYLLDAKILVRLIGRKTEEAAYALGPSGRMMVAEQRGVDVADLDFAAPKPDHGLFWSHHRLTCDTLISFELACRGGATGEEPALVCARTIGEWILQKPREVRKKHERFLLFEQFSGGVVCRPDGAVLLSPRDNRALTVAGFLECDRGTESMIRIAGKIEGYWRRWLKYFQPSSTDSFMGASAMRVLFVLGNVRQDVPMGEVPRRIVSMIREVEAFVRASKGNEVAERFARCFLFAVDAELDERTVLTEPIWWNVEREQRPLYRPVARQEAA